MSTLNTKPFPLGTRSVRFAALTFRQLEAMKEQIDLLMSPASANFAKPEARQAIIDVAMASLAHESPAVTQDELLDALDTFNFSLVVTAIFDRNGFLAEPDADAGAGEAAAAASAT